MFCRHPKNLTAVLSGYLNSAGSLKESLSFLPRILFRRNFTPRRRRRRFYSCDAVSVVLSCIIAKQRRELVTFHYLMRRTMLDSPIWKLFREQHLDRRAFFVIITFALPQKDAFEIRIFLRDFRVCWQSGLAFVCWKLARLRECLPRDRLPIPMCTITLYYMKRL